VKAWRILLAIAGTALAAFGVFRRVSETAVHSLLILALLTGTYVAVERSNRSLPGAGSNTRSGWADYAATMRHNLPSYSRHRAKGAGNRRAGLAGGSSSIGSGRCGRGRCPQ
jgi:hypothetical protein